MTDPAPSGELSILHVAQPTDHGVAVCVAALARDQRERGWDVGVACPPSGFLFDEVRAAGVRHHPWPAERAPHRGLLRERRALAAAVAAHDPDVVHLHSAKAGLTGRALLRGRVHTLFQPHAWSYEALDGPAREAAVRWERVASRWASTIVCCSDGEASSGRRFGVRGDLLVVPNAVDVARFAPLAAPERRERRRALGLGLGDAPVAVCVGRLSPQKGQDLLVDAWSSVAASVPGAVLAIVGDGPLAPELRDRAGGRSDIRFVGASDDVAGWLGAADLAVLPSRYEGMALGVIEAIATGTAVVTSDADGMREVVGDGADAAGGVVPVGDVRALAAAIVERLLDPERRAEEGRRGRARALARHDRRAWFDRFAELSASAAGAW